MALTPAERKRRQRERERNDEIAVRGTIHKSNQQIWDKINIDNQEKETESDKQEE